MPGGRLLSHSAVASETAQPGPSNISSAFGTKRDDTNGGNDHHENGRSPIAASPAAAAPQGITAEPMDLSATESPSETVRSEDETVHSVEQIKAILKGVDAFLVEIPGLPGD